MQLKPQPKTQPRENILPLINVVFLLLIFFMLAGAFTDPELFKINIPTATNDNNADKKTLMLLMNSDGELAFNNSQVSQEELRAIIINKVANSSLFQIQLKADADVDAIRLVELMEMLSDTGLKSLHLLTVSPES